MQRILLFLLVSSLITASCASRKLSESLPVVMEEKKEVSKKTEDSVKVNVQDPIEPTTCVVRLLLPLRLKEHFDNDTVPDQPLLYDNAIASLHAYLGAMAALDSLKDLPLKLSVEVVDVAGDSLEIIGKIRSKAFVKADIAISFLPATYNDLCIKSARNAKCRLILQGTSNSSAAINNPYLWYSTATNNTQLAMLCEYLLSESPSADYLVLTRKTRSENVLAGFIAARLDSLAGKKVSRQMELTKDKWEEIHKSLPKNKKINLIVPTQDEAYLQSVINKIKTLDDTYIIRLVGLPSWESFESVDPAKLAEYNTCIFNALYIDAENARLQSFRKAFIDLNHVDPLPVAYQAYDLVRYFAMNYNEYGKDAGIYKTVDALELPKAGLNFHSVCDECGYENKSLNILRYADYKLVRVVEYQR